MEGLDEGKERGKSGKYNIIQKIKKFKNKGNKPKKHI